MAPAALILEGAVSVMRPVGCLPRARQEQLQAGDVVRAGTRVGWGVLSRCHYESQPVGT